MQSAWGMENIVNVEARIEHIFAPQVCQFDSFFEQNRVMIRCFGDINAPNINDSVVLTFVMMSCQVMW